MCTYLLVQTMLNCTQYITGELIGGEMFSNGLANICLLQYYNKYIVITHFILCKPEVERIKDT